ncbi:unnamed protein product [Ectocarpus fasciculatus]
MSDSFDSHDSPVAPGNLTSLMWCVRVQTAVLGALQSRYSEHLLVCPLKFQRAARVCAYSPRTGCITIMQCSQTATAIPSCWLLSRYTNCIDLFRKKRYNCVPADVCDCIIRGVKK